MQQGQVASGDMVSAAPKAEQTLGKRGCGISGQDEITWTRRHSAGEIGSSECDR